MSLLNDSKQRIKITALLPLQKSCYQGSIIRLYILICAKYVEKAVYKANLLRILLSVISYKNNDQTSAICADYFSAFFGIYIKKALQITAVHNNQETTEKSVYIKGKHPEN